MHNRLPVSPLSAPLPQPPAATPAGGAALLPPIGPPGAPGASTASVASQSSTSSDGGLPAALSGNDAITVLVSQHRRLERLLRALAADAPAAHIDDIVNTALRDAAIALRTEQLQQVADEMALHMGAEEAVLYPAARAAPNDDVLLQALEEHLALRQLLARLLGMTPADAGFAPACGQLQALAERQHSTEETQLFPALRRLAGRQRRAELGTQMLRYQEELRRRGRPRDSLLAYRDHDAAAPHIVGEPAH